MKPKEPPGWSTDPMRHLVSRFPRGYVPAFWRRLARVRRLIPGCHSAGAEFNEEQDVEPPEEHRVDGEELAGHDALVAWAVRNWRRVELARFRISHTVKGATRCPRAR
jgi:hypothetical protein